MKKLIAIATVAAFGLNLAACDKKQAEGEEAGAADASAMTDATAQPTEAQAIPSASATDAAAKAK